MFQVEKFIDLVELLILTQLELYSSIKKLEYCLQFETFNYLTKYLKTFDQRARLWTVYYPDSLE